MDRLLRKGSTGDDVRAVQDVLNHHIRRLAPLGVDGVFGPLTEARVREFQRVNKLVVDGIVGPNTRKLLFEVSIVPIWLALVLRSTPVVPGLPPGPQRPFPAPPVQLPKLVGLRLLPGALVPLPGLGDPSNLFQLTLKVPSRNDPGDPYVASYRNLVSLVDQLPADAKFKAFLIDKIPTPITRITPPSAGFDWGLKPVFDPFDPTGFGATGNAAFTVRVSGGEKKDAPNIVVGAWGQGRLFLNFDTRQGEARPRVEAQGTFTIGARGVF